MKIVGEKLPPRKFKNGQKVRCIGFHDLKGIVVGHIFDNSAPMKWYAKIRITHVPDSRNWVAWNNAVRSLYEDRWELQP